MPARIYQPAKTAMQSGKSGADKWVLAFEPEAPRKIEPLMGYTSSSDMRAQVKLDFASLEEAIAYVEGKGLAYTVQKSQKARRRKIAYADNFSFSRKLPWTH